MLISDALSKFNIEAQEDINDVIPLNFLQHLNKAHIYHNYIHLAYTLYKHKSKHANIKANKERPAKMTKCKHKVEKKYPKNQLHTDKSWMTHPIC